LVPASYLYSDSNGSHFLDQESYETLTLADEVMGNALDFLIGGALVELLKYNGNPIGLELPMFVELEVASTEPGVRGDSSSGSVTKPAKLETGLEIRVPLFIKEGEKVKVSTESRGLRGGHDLLPAPASGAWFWWKGAPVAAESPAESGSLRSAMTSTLQHAQIGAPRTHCITILVGHHAG
jgi:hypothetical protein